MRVGIVGAGASGIFLALKLKEIDKSIEVTLIEQKDKVGKKIYATGNGKCNIANTALTFAMYNHNISHLVNQSSVDEILRTFNSWGIPLKKVNNLLYPYNESAKTLMEILITKLHEFGVKILLDTNVVDYRSDKSIELLTNKGTYIFDYLIFASGGKSSPQFGSDGSSFLLLEKHNYKITNLHPGLCPLKTKESTKKLQGLRIKGDIKLLAQNKIIHKESGEVLFKKDGLSGIAIFNISSMIARTNINESYQIAIDCFPKFSHKDLFNLFMETNNHSKNHCFLKGFFIDEIVNDILLKCHLENKCSYSKLEIETIANICKNYRFTYDSLYDFTDSQVTVGGLELNNLDDNLMSKYENNIYFCGEILDIDGLSGGYNLLWAFISSNKVAKSICKEYSNNGSK